MFCCFGARARRSQPAPARDRSVVMASARVNNVPAAGQGGADSSMASPRSSGYFASSKRSLGGAEEGERSGVVVAPLQPAEAVVWPVEFGSLSEPGLRRKSTEDTEDTVSLRRSFCVWADGSQMHFFAVFDGHGGPEVSALCRDQMHAILAEELALSAAAYRVEHHPAEDEEAELRAWKAALTRSFTRADALGASAVPSAYVVGSTAVVELLVRGHLLVANSGDSRAVLCRAGRAIPLSQDHKLERRPDEVARVEAAGDTVFFHNGMLRVRGILGMSRALGHRFLKPGVICVPEITITTRSWEDDCLILASDGIWDAISNQEACHVARKCLEDMGKDDAQSQYLGALVGPEDNVRCVNAALVLTRLAIARSSPDDISVVVVDLKVRG
uniref:Uncharacterized protein n=1 Tax=Avena sativa TaxID=4498 RepID=A0ACD5TWU7_AVESA